jgi:RHS repeat-associated protein
MDIFVVAKAGAIPDPNGPPANIQCSDQFLALNRYFPDLLMHKDYYAGGMQMPGRSYISSSYRYGFGGKEKDDEIKGAGNSYDFEARILDPRLCRWVSVDPLAAQFPWQSPYVSMDNNPIMLTDPTGMSASPPDWVEKSDGSIKWDENVTSANDKDLQAGDKYLGKNVLVGTHNRDASLNEPINTAKFDLYLESNKEGPSATIMGNTVPADNKTAGTLAEGLYPARSQGRASYLAEKKEDLALIINEGKSVPTAPGSPKSSMTEVFFHSGNNYQKSLFDSKGKPYSAGCQTGGCGPGSLLKHNEFMKVGGADFKGSYYLRSQPKLEVPKSK